MPRVPGTRRLFRSILALLVLALLAGGAGAQQDSDQDSGRVALVIGNAAYPARPLVTAVNDAGLVAEMVRNAGYDLVEARDVDETLLRQTVRDFLDKVAAAGPDAVAFVYLSGYGLQFEGENYFVPVSARLARVSDIPTETFRVGDLLRALAGMNVAARVVVLDMGRVHPFFGGARAVPPGLAVVEPGEGMLVAFSAGPGQAMREGGGPYGLYAPALVEMAAKPGVPLDQIFAQVRLRVHEASRGAITPWHRSRIAAPVFFFEGDVPDDAPPPQAELNPQAQQLLGRPLGSLSPDQAYSVVLERDAIDAYQEFIAAFPNHPLTKRVRLLLAERREALIWRRAVSANTPQAYWSYLRRYPRGPHAPEARRRLAALTAPVEPPADFAMLEYGVPPPTDDEVAFYEDYYGTYYGGPPPDYAPPPPFPVFFLPPLEREFVDLPPPVYYQGVAYLPVPGAIVFRRAIRPARPVFIFRHRGDGPRRMWRRPEVINRFGGQAPRMLRDGQRQIRDGRPVVPQVQPGVGGLPKDQNQRRLIEQQQERERLQQQQRDRVFQEKQKDQKQRDRLIQEKQKQDQQQRDRVQQEKQKGDQQRQLQLQQERERALGEKQKQEQPRGVQQQQQLERERALREKQNQEQPRGGQQQQQLERERAIGVQRQQQEQQQRAIQQQQQQQQQQQRQQQPQQQQQQPRPGVQQQPRCPRGTNPDGSCR